MFAHHQAVPRRHAPDRRQVAQLCIVILALCVVSLAAAAGWLLAGGTLPAAETLLGQSPPAADESRAGVPVHLASSPTGAQVQIDGASYGSTPLDARLAPGQHALRWQHPEALDDQETLQVDDTGVNLDIVLWRRRPTVVALRPVYPGASLLDARFLNDGQVTLLVGAPTTGRELWRLDPSTGQLGRVEMPDADAPPSLIVLAPDGTRLAYVTPGSSAAVTSAGWSAPQTTSAASRPESLWLAAVDGAEPPRRIYALAPVNGPKAPVSPEHIVDLVWTPDNSRLVVVIRQTGQPPRTRIVLLSIAGPGGVPDTNELVLLPADVLAGSAAPDPTGQWLALVTDAPVAPGGANLLNLCILALQPGGSFRDLADLGSVDRMSSTAPLDWAPVAVGTPARLVYVGPAPPTASTGGGLLGLADLFRALRPPAAPSGLFVADLERAGLDAAQPRRLGTALNTFGLVWRSETTLLGFARQGDGTLALRSIEPASGGVQDLGVRLPASTAQGTGPAARWDAAHGQALLLARPSGGTADAGVGSRPLQAWLVSFVPPGSTAGVAH